MSRMPLGFRLVVSGCPWDGLILLSCLLAKRPSLNEGLTVPLADGPDCCSFPPTGRGRFAEFPWGESCFLFLPDGFSACWGSCDETGATFH
eukprot:scaffold1146_cov399-Prasinococcus_capsulatus_cf.AAC.25